MAGVAAIVIAAGGVGLYKYKKTEEARVEKAATEAATRQAAEEKAAAAERALARSAAEEKAAAEQAAARKAAEEKAAAAERALARRAAEEKAAAEQAAARKTAEEKAAAAQVPAQRRTMKPVGTISLVYPGDYFACQLILTVTIGHKIFVPNVNPFFAREVPLGNQEYSIEGQIGCPTAGFCNARGSGSINLRDGSVFNILWLNIAPGTCDIKLVPQ